MEKLSRALRRSLSVVALALVILMAGLTGSASAAVVGLEVVSPASASNSADKGVTANCPAGKRLLGAGGDSTGSMGDVLLDDIRPSADLKSLRVNALEDEDGTSVNWHVQAFAICAYPPPGLVRVAATSAPSSANKSVAANCPAGKRLLGLGGEINSGNRQVLLDDLRPNSTLTSATVSAVEDETGNPGNWSLTAYAICANPVAGLQRVSLVSALDSSEPKLIEAPCGLSKRVVGVGGDINGPNGQVVLDAVFPNATMTGARMGAWEDDTGTTANWSVRAYAICANSVDRVVTESFPESAPQQSMDAGCPGDKQLTGLGGDITGGFGQVVMTILAPFHLITAARVEGVEDADGTPSNWTVRAYALCVTPPPGLELVQAISALDNSSPKTMTAVCPAGKKVLGTGGVVTRDPDAFPAVVLEDLIPNGALTSVQVTAAELFPGTNVNWQLTADAICANPPPGLQRVVASSASDSEELKSVTATCPAGKHLVGTGAEVFPTGDVVLDDLRPNDALTNVTVTGIEPETGNASDWLVRAYAVCANH